MSDMSVNTTPSGMTGAGGGNKLRIVGMATGLDVDAMVQKMMKPYQLKISNEKIRLQKIQWKQDAYRDIIKDIKGLQDEFFNILKSSSMITKADNYTAYTATSSDSSVASAYASSNAVEGSYDISVINLAKQGEIKSSSEINVGDVRAKLSTKLSEIGINTNDEISFKVTYDENGVSKEYIKTVKVDDAENETLGSFMDRVRRETEGKVVAAYDEISGNVIFRTSGTGTNSKIEITNVKVQNPEGTDVVNNILDKLGITSDMNAALSETGRNAHFKIKSPYGGELEVTDNQTNVYNVNGLTINLGNKEGTVDNPAKATIAIKADDEAPIKMIKGFIGKYNDLVDMVQLKLTEKTNRDFKPLTDEQKKLMSKDEIEKWEAKAKEGLLKSDPLLTEMMTGIRRAFFDMVEGAGISFGREIGLDTSSGVDENNRFVSSESGKILFTAAGEEKLKEALKNHRNEIIDLFTKTSDSTDKNEKYNNQGIFSRINDILVDYVGRAGTTLNTAKLTSMANKQNDFSMYGTGTGNSLPDQINRKNNYIKTLTEKMTAEQERYYKQFSILETAMERLNAQSAWLYQQYGGQ